MYPSRSGSFLFVTVLAEVYNPDAQSTEDLPRDEMINLNTIRRITPDPERMDRCYLHIDGQDMTVTVQATLHQLAEILNN